VLDTHIGVLDTHTQTLQLTATLDDVNLSVILK